MTSSFRQAMGWLHTWAGVLCSVLLFAMFWMGTLSVFDREIDRWMLPHTRLVAPPSNVRLDNIVVPILNGLHDKASVYIQLPTSRDPTLRIGYEDNGNWKLRHIDPRTGICKEPT